MKPEAVTESGDAAALDAAVAQHLQTFFGKDLYPDLTDKAAALGFSLIQNHPFVDGNKRTGYEAMTVFLDANGQRIMASVDEAERVILAVASGLMDREEFTEWVRGHIVPRER